MGDTAKYRKEEKLRLNEDELAAEKEEEKRTGIKLGLPAMWPCLVIEEKDSNTPAYSLFIFNSPLYKFEHVSTRDLIYTCLRVLLVSLKKIPDDRKMGMSRRA